MKSQIPSTWCCLVLPLPQLFLSIRPLLWLLSSWSNPGEQKLCVHNRVCWRCEHIPTARLDDPAALESLFLGLVGVVWGCGLVGFFVC